MESLLQFLNHSFQTVGLQILKMDTVTPVSKPSEPSEQQQRQQQQQQPQEQQQMLTQPTKLTMRTKRPQLSCNPCRQRKVKVGTLLPATSSCPGADGGPTLISVIESHPVALVLCIRWQTDAITICQKQRGSQLFKQKH